MTFGTLFHFNYQTIISKILKPNIILQVHLSLPSTLSLYLYPDVVASPVYCSHSKPCIAWAVPIFLTPFSLLQEGEDNWRDERQRSQAETGTFYWKQKVQEMNDSHRKPPDNKQYTTAPSRFAPPEGTPSPMQIPFFSQGNDMEWYRITSVSSWLLQKLPCPGQNQDTSLFYQSLQVFFNLCFTSIVLLSLSACKLAIHFYKYYIKRLKSQKHPYGKKIDYTLELSNYMPFFFFLNFALQEERFQYFGQWCKNNVCIHKKLRPESLKLSQVSLQKCTNSTLR